MPTPSSERKLSVQSVTIRLEHHDNYGLIVCSFHLISIQMLFVFSADGDMGDK